MANKKRRANYGAPLFSYASSETEADAAADLSRAVMAAKAVAGRQEQIDPFVDRRVNAQFDQAAAVRIDALQPEGVATADILNRAVAADIALGGQLANLITNNGTAISADSSACSQTRLTTERYWSWKKRSHTRTQRD